MDEAIKVQSTEAEAADVSEEITIEEAFARLNEALDRMESGKLSLEESFSLYEEGLKLVSICEGKIDLIEKKLKILEKR